MVADAFLGPIPEGLFVNHIDGGKANNTLANIEYVTSQVNNQHAYDTGLNHKTLTRKDIPEIRVLIGVGFSYSKIALLYKVSKATIGRINTRENWKHV